MDSTITVFNLMLNNPDWIPRLRYIIGRFPGQHSWPMAAMVDFKHQKSWFYGYQPGLKHQYLDGYPLVN